MGLQILQGEAQVQDGFGAGAHHHDGGVGQLFQIGRDIHGGLGAAVYAADAPGGKDLDAGHVGDDHGSGDGGGAVLAAGHQHGQIPAAGLIDGVALLAQILDLLGGQTGLQTTAQNGDGGGHGAVLADDGFDLESGLHILRVGHAVGDDGGFQGDDRLAGGDGGGHLGGDVEILVHRHLNDLHKKMKIKIEKAERRGRLIVRRGL